MADTDGFGGRLRRAIEARSLDQKRFAKRMEIREATISGWIRGRYMPRLAELLRVIEILDVSADWLLFGVGSMERVKHENGADPFVAGAAYAMQKMAETIFELTDAIGVSAGKERERTPEEQERLERLAWLAQDVLRRRGSDHQQTQDGGA